HAVRIAGMATGDDLEHRGAVLGAARHRSDVVEAVAERDTTGLGYPAEGGHQAGDAAERGRDPDASPGVRAEPGQEHPGGDSASGTGAGTSRPGRGVPRVT